VSGSINYDDLRLQHSVESNIAFQFLQKVEDRFNEFIKRYTSFFTPVIILKWYLSSMKACNERAQDLFGRRQKTTGLPVDE